MSPRTRGRKSFSSKYSGKRSSKPPASSNAVARMASTAPESARTGVVSVSDQKAMRARAAPAAASRAEAGTRRERAPPRHEAETRRERALEHVIVEIGGREEPFVRVVPEERGAGDGGVRGDERVDRAVRENHVGIRGDDDLAVAGAAAAVDRGGVAGVASG